MAQDIKYGNITVEKCPGTSIGEDEPVILFRAQDQTLLKLIAYYTHLCMKAGSPAEHIVTLVEVRDNVTAWQNLHGCKVPD